MDQWGPLAFMPFKKCSVDENPRDLNTISDLTIHKQDNTLSRDEYGISFECDDDFVQADNVPPDQIDEECFPEYAAT